MMRLGGWIKSRRGLAAMLAVALGCALFAPPSHAASSIILFNPTGGGFGAGQAVNEFNVSQFTYSPGSALAVGAVQALQNAALGSGPTTFQVYFQSALGGVGATPVVAGQGISINTPDLPVPPAAPQPGGNGDIRVIGGTPTDTGRMITLVGTFTEQVQSFNPATGQASFVLAPTQVMNNVTLYNLPASSANESTGTGFVGTPAQAILTGTVTSGIPGFSFSSNFGVPTGSTPGSQSNPVPFDSYSQAGYTSPWTATTPNSVSGTGGVNLPVLVSSTNGGFFQQSPGIFALTFPQFGTGLPFTTQPPSTSVDGQTAFGTLGTTNGNIGPGGNPGTNIEFVTQGTNSFTVPEPSTLFMAAISIGFVSAACLRSRRRRS